MMWPGLMSTPPDWWWCSGARGARSGPASGASSPPWLASSITGGPNFTPEQGGSPTRAPCHFDQPVATFAFASEAEAGVAVPFDGKLVAFVVDPGLRYAAEQQQGELAGLAA